MTFEIEIRPLQSVPIDEIIDLMSLCLGEFSTRTEEFWRWKHLDNPFGPSPGLVAIADGRVVALRVFMRWTWLWDGNEITAVRAVDTATHPEWQRRGLFRQLTEQLKRDVESEGVGFVFNTPNRKSRAGYLKMGWESVGHMPIMAKIGNPLKVAAHFLGSGRSVEDGTELGPLLSAESVLTDPTLDIFLERIPVDPNRLQTRRSGKYLRWRYAGSAGPSYSAFGDLDATDGGALLIVRRRKRHRLTGLVIAECLVTSNEEGLEALAAQLEEIGQISGIDYVVVAGGMDPRASRTFCSAGYRFVGRRGPELTVNRLADLGSTSSLDSWNLSLGDLEVF